eukprot:2834266-Alexandrium_andersonii.AAC.1
MSEVHPQASLRLLADDLLVHTEHDSSAEPDPAEWARAHEDRVRDTIAYIVRMGGKVSPQKCKHVSTSDAVRAQLRRTQGPGAIPVMTDMRDLGTHLALGKRLVAPTIARRFEAAGKALDSIGNLKAPFKYK